jgi:hypothetical protein
MKTTIEDDHLIYYDCIDLINNNDEDDDEMKNIKIDKVKSFYITCLLNIAGKYP